MMEVVYLCASLFPFGQLLSTPGAVDTFGHEVLLDCFQRHITGDWGDLDPEDIAENELSLKRGYRLLSAYNLDGGRLWIITEADRSYTTMMLPSEY